MPFKSKTSTRLRVITTEGNEELEEQPIELKQSTAYRIPRRRAHAKLDKTIKKQFVVAQGTPFVEYMEAGQGG